MPLAGLAQYESIERSFARVLPQKTAENIAEFLVFGAKEAASCVFAGSFLFLLAVSGHIHIPGLNRYDFLFLSAIAISPMRSIRGTLLRPGETGVTSPYRSALRVSNKYHVVPG